MTELREAEAAWAAATHFYFHGVIHPADGSWYFEEPITFSAGDQRFSITVQRSGLRVLVNGNTALSAEDFYAQVRGHVQGCIDALGYALGAHLTAEIQGGFGSTPDGRQLSLEFNHRWRDLPGQAPADEVPASDLAPLVSASLESPLLRAALSDLSKRHVGLLRHQLPRLSRHRDRPALALRRGRVGETSGGSLRRVVTPPHDAGNNQGRLCRPAAAIGAATPWRTPSNHRARTRSRPRPRS